MIRSLGVRYVMVHAGDYDGASIAAGAPERTIQAFVPAAVPAACTFA